MKSNIFKKLTMTALGTFIVSSGAMAVTPYGYDQFTVTAGVITDTNAGGCAVGFTCVDLEANDLGIMQRTVTDDGTGVSYLQTVITESDATGAATALDFSIEAYVYTAGVNANNIALQQRITGDMDFLVDITEGSFETGGDITDPNSVGDGVTVRLFQTVDFNGGDFQEYTQIGANGGGDFQEVNQRVSGQGTDERFTVRTNNATTAGGTLGGGADIGAVAYAAGESVRVVWLAADQPGGTAQQQFGIQRYQNLDTLAEASRVSSDGNTFGLHDDNGPWEWDALFGAAPAAPPATPAFP